MDQNEALEIVRIARKKRERANLSRADLNDANLSGADLSRADLSRANLSRADLNDANLSGADLSRADLSRADLSVADLGGADLSGANLSGANLSGADLSGADLSGADLSGANLNDANLSRADLSGANLSRAQGLLSSIAFMAKFERDAEGWVVYKAVGGTSFAAPERWVFEPGAFLEETVNPSRVSQCACGVNFASLEWVKENYPQAREIWRCRVRFEDGPGVVVPFGTDGKARCERLQLIEKI